MIVRPMHGRLARRLAGSNNCPRPRRSGCSTYARRSSLALRQTLRNIDTKAQALQIERVALLQRCMAVESRLLDLVPGNPRVIASAAASAAALAAARLQQGQFDEGQALLGRARAHRDELASTGWTGDTVDLDRQLRLLQLAYAEQRARTATEARVNPPARRLLAGTQNGKKPDPDA